MITANLPIKNLYGTYDSFDPNCSSDVSTWCVEGTISKILFEIFFCRCFEKMYVETTYRKQMAECLLMFVLYCKAI